MSLATRLNSVVATRGNRGCVTCSWVETLPKNDRRAFDEWVRSGKSLSQLWEISTTLEADALKVCHTAFRNHCRHHRFADES